MTCGVGRSGLGVLSPIQSKIMGMLSEGISNKEIGRQLDINPETVATHITRAKIKLCAETPRKAVIAYIRNQYAGWAGELEYLSWAGR